MKSYFKNLIKKKSVLAVFTVAIVGGLVSGALAGFGPDRPTKVYHKGVKGFNHVTFNSFTNVPNIGDERKFYHGKVAGAPGGFYDPMNNVRDGNKLLVRVYVHNNADKSLNSKKNNFKGIARNTTVKVNLNENKLAKTHQSTAFISADNAKPKTVFDTLDVNAPYKFKLDYVEGSARVKTNFVDKKLSDSIVNGGVKIGHNNQNGNLKGCFEFVALVTFEVKVKAPNYDIEKSVRVEGEGKTQWRENAHVEPGQTVEWKLEFNNTGRTKLDDVAMFDDHPDKLDLVSGSTMIYNASNPSGVNAGSDAVVANGINVGNYFPKSNAIVVFKAKAPSENELECGVNKFVNDGYVKPKGHGAVKDSASVTVNRECDEPKEPRFACDLLTAEKLGGRKVKFTVDASASDGANIVNYIYNFGDGTDELLTDQTMVEHTYAEDGTYNASVQVVVNVDGEVRTISGENCQASITFTTPPDEEVPPREDVPVTVTSLPSAGPGDMLAIVAGVVATSTIGYLAVARKFLGL